MRLVVDIDAARRVVGEKLAPREWHTFLGILRGQTQRQIAKDVGVKFHSISMAKRRIFDKLDLWNDVELIAFAGMSGILKDVEQVQPRKL